jgi:hypothetical protein
VTPVVRAVWRRYVTDGMRDDEVDVLAFVPLAGDKWQDEYGREQHQARRVVAVIAPKDGEVRQVPLSELVMRAEQKPS